MKRKDLDKIFFVYLNCINHALNMGNIKLAKKHLEQMFKEYTKIREGSSNLKSEDVHKTKNTKNPGKNEVKEMLS